MQRPERASQSLLQKLDTCHYSGKLYLEKRGSRIQSHAMARGTAYHEFRENFDKEWCEKGEVIPPDVAREMMQEVIEKRTDLVIPAAEVHALRGMSWNTAVQNETQPLDPRSVVGIEVEAQLELDGWTLMGRIDLCQKVGGEIYLRDYKTGLQILSQEEFDQSFQTRFYALLVAEGTINGRRIGEGVKTFHVAEEYPRYLTEEKTLFRRRGVLDENDIADFKRHVEHLLGVLERRLEDEQWTPSPGSHCSRCPAYRECPLPTSQRPEVIETEEQARALAEDLHLMEKHVKDSKAALKAWVDENGELRYGDQEWGFRPVTSTRTDKAAMEDALHEGGVDPRQFLTTSTSTRFQLRKAA